MTIPVWMVSLYGVGSFLFGVWLGNARGKQNRG